MNNNKQFTAAKDDSWIDETNPFALKIVVEEKEQKTRIPEGKFSWTFPVKVPCYEVPCKAVEDFPRNNFWLLSVCWSDLCESHLNYTLVLATFAHAGFEADEKSPETIAKELAAAGSTTTLSISFPVFIILLMY